MTDRCEVCGARRGLGDNQWISVKDRLPEEGVLVLTFSEYKGNQSIRLDHVIILEHSEEPYVWAYRLVEDWHLVTHWMPLPQRPN